MTNEDSNILKLQAAFLYEQVKLVSLTWEGAI